MVYGRYETLSARWTLYFQALKSLFFFKEKKMLSLIYLKHFPTSTKRLFICNKKKEKFMWGLGDEIIIQRINRIA